MLSEDFAFSIGQYLRSDAVGAQGEFIGDVVRITAEGVHVRDAQGRLWARTRAELSETRQPVRARAFAG